MSQDVMEYLRSKNLNLKSVGGREVHTACFFCGEDDSKRGRLYINVDPYADIPGLWFCHLCGAKGNIVTLQKHFGDYQQPLEDDTSYVRMQILAAACDWYHESLDEAAYRWLTGSERGLEAETIVEFRLGYAPPGARNQLCHALQDLGFKTSDILATGLAIKDRDTDQCVDTLSRMVTIPYFVAGNCVAIRGRAWPAQDGKPKYKTPPGQPARLFHSEAVWGADEVCVAEGELDALVLHQMGFNAVAVPGANVWQENWKDYFSNVRRAWVIFDPDEAGDKGAEKLIDQLGARARRVRLPGDVTDWVNEGHNAEELRQHMAEAGRSRLLVSVHEAAAEFRTVQDQPGLKLGIERLDYLIDPGIHPNQVVVLIAKSGVGKSCAKFAEVATPTGYRKFGDLVVGDEVFGSDGQPTKVAGVYEQGVRPLVRMGFSDGTSVLCDEEHLWTVRFRYGHRREWTAKTMSTKELMVSDLRRGPEWRWTIPMCEPVAFPEQDLPIEPYTLGALIANGALGGVSTVLSTPDQGVVARVGRSTRVHRINDSDPKACPRYTLSGLLPAIRALGLNVKSGKKFIPDQYLIASITQRVALLQGLMDGDGHSRAKDGRRAVNYFTTSPRLANDMVQLVTSLGGTCMPNWYERDDKVPECRLNIMLPEEIPAFSTDRKPVAGPGKHHSEPRRAIVSIEREGEADCRCIAVDAPDSLYLIGREHIVTHNTVMLLNMMQRAVMVPHQGSLRFLFVSLEQTGGEWFDRARRLFRFYNPSATDAQAEQFWAPRLRIIEKNRLSEDDLVAALDDFEYEMGGKPDLVLVDYLGYFAQSFRGERYERTSDAIMAIKAIAKDRRVPFIVPQQVNRSSRYGDEPDIDSVRDAGTILETADFMFTLWTEDDRHGRSEDEKSGAYYLRLGKSRHGHRGAKVEFQFAPLSLAHVPAGEGHWARMARNEMDWLRQGVSYQEAAERHRQSSGALTAVR